MGRHNRMKISKRIITSEARYRRGNCFKQNYYDRDLLMVGNFDDVDPEYFPRSGDYFMGGFIRRNQITKAKFIPKGIKAFTCGKKSPMEPGPAVSTCSVHSRTKLLSKDLMKSAFN
jgi:hypothetical protein